MSEEKKTEEQLKNEIIEEYGFDEGDERIDKILQIQKDKYKAIQQKKREREEAENFKKAKDHYKKIAKQAEKEPNRQKKEDNFSLMDIRALSDVHDDDVDEIVGYAKFKNISIAEAKKSTVIQTYLRESQEQREASKASNKTNNTRKTSKDDDARLLSDFEKGKVPESDEDFERLAQLKSQQRREALKR